MNAIEIIEKKKRNELLSKEELSFFINEYVDNNLPDYQMSAFLMAVCINGLCKSEINDLTSIYIASGEVIDFKGKFKHIADKHSTGGVGDKTSLIIGPIIASCGVVIAKMSGRGLGHTGGTIDKLESIPGFRVELSDEEFMDVVSKHKLSIIGQTKNLVAADKKIYALRDVSGTVDSIPLIAASIMSKKLASGSDNILIDVKVGSGAIMDTYEESLELAKTMVEIGKSYNKNTYAILSDMNQPLGYAVGNKLEVIEAMKFLQGEYAADLYELCIEISSLLVSSCLEISIEDSIKMISENLNNGSALKCFKEFIVAQGGSLDGYESEFDEVKVANVINIYAKSTGYVNEINALVVANVAKELGAGRFVKTDLIDNNVGVLLKCKVNDFVNEGDLLASVYANSKGVDFAQSKLESAFIIKESVNENIKIIYDVIK